MLPPVAERVDKVCESFEAAWKTAGTIGQRPRIEDYLGTTTEPERSALLSQLIALDFAYRRRAGEEPQAEEYANRFPALAAGLVTTLTPNPMAAAVTEAEASPQGAGAPNHSEEVPPTRNGERDAGPYDFLAPPQGPDELGRLGPYRVLKVLGAGGMGIVFQAEDPQLQRLLALKVMKPGLAVHADSRQRFLREARAAAAIEHDHIVSIYHVGEDRGVPFLAMPLLRGESLEDRLRRCGKPALAETLRIGRETAEALAAAHQHGLIHRDIKPSNLWLEGERGRVKVVDFGLARAAGSDTPLTQVGVVVGTPQYMAPEQAAGTGVDFRCDLFSLGCILYRLCTDQLPFRGSDTLSILSALALEQPRPPRQFDPTLPPALSDLVLRLLAKNAADRPPSAQVVAEALAAIEGEQVANAAGHAPPSEATVQADIPLPPAEARPQRSEAYLSQLRLVVEDLSCDLCRFEHVLQDHVAPESVRIDREYDLGVAGAFADIRVAVPGQAPYFVEVKYGYSRHRLVQSLRRKFGSDTPANREAAKVVLVLDCAGRPDWPQLESELTRCLRPHLKLEIWDEERLIALLRQRFGITIGSITEDDLLDVRQTIDRAKGWYAFGGSSLAEYDNDPLRSQLLWHFGFWRLRQLRESQGVGPRDILPPGLYRGVAVLVADFCAFADYVHDTREEEVIRDCLTSFYSKARYQILNRGGMLCQFVGDEVFALFGIPDRRPGYLQDALETAQALLSTGLSVSNHWQRHIDRAQSAAGLHIGMALGDVQIVGQRPFSRTHVGAIGDPIHVATMLVAQAEPSEIAVSNSFYEALGEEARVGFQEIESVNAHKGRRIKAWKRGRDPAGG
jgi:serine/threonine protein kinase/class 3 adenylate cyclase